MKDVAAAEYNVSGTRSWSRGRGNGQHVKQDATRPSTG